MRIKDGVYDSLAAHPIARGRLEDYFEILPEGAFKMIRPKWQAGE
jgi:hypothetical protein